MRNIWLTYIVDPKTSSFLNLHISIVGDRLTTCTYRKLTAANTLLQASSHHPDHLVKGIPMGQFLQIHRNCSRDDDFHREAGEIRFSRFRDRGYSYKVLKKARRQ